MSEAPRPTLWTSGLWAFLAAAAMLVWVAMGNRSEDVGAVSPRSGQIIGAANPGEAERLAELLGEARRVLMSPAMKANLLALQSRYPLVYASDQSPSTPMARIAAIVALEARGARFAPAQVALIDDGGEALGAAGEGAVSGRYSDVMISRPVLAAFLSEDVVRKSCAINVAAHEYAHTIVLTPMGYGLAFTDTGDARATIRNRGDPKSPVASYLIGAVAQCSWLETRGRIDRSEIPACVEAFGVRAFNWNRCGLFADGAPVAERPGLPPPAPPL
jgi:hypothetical protein